MTAQLEGSDASASGPIFLANWSGRIAVGSQYRGYAACYAGLGRKKLIRRNAVPIMIADRVDVVWARGALTLIAGDIGIIRGTSTQVRRH